MKSSNIAWFLLAFHGFSPSDNQSQGKTWLGAKSRVIVMKAETAMCPNSKKRRPDMRGCLRIVAAFYCRSTIFQTLPIFDYSCERALREWQVRSQQRESCPFQPTHGFDKRSRPSSMPRIVSDEEDLTQVRARASPLVARMSPATTFLQDTIERAVAGQYFEDHIDATPFVTRLLFRPVFARELTVPFAPSYEPLQVSHPTRSGHPLSPAALPLNCHRSDATTRRINSTLRPFYLA